MQSCFVDRSALLSSLKNRCPGKQSPTGTPNFIRIGEWIATSAISFCSFIHKWQCVVNATREDLSRKCFSGGESGNGWCGPFLKKNISDWDVKRLISYVQENLCYKLNSYIFFIFYGLTASNRFPFHSPFGQACTVRECGKASVASYILLRLRETRCGYASDCRGPRKEVHPAVC